ncbi:MAG TPA: 50S ribosomal protein L11 methyltransferase [Bacteroidales bacterium]|nr:50S ribosomal protein L11 methyltransferase [Bacteroidales bacterium]
MKYIEISCKTDLLEEWQIDLLADELMSIGADSYVVEDQTLKAYILKKDFNSELLDFIELPFDFTPYFSIIEPEDINWNENWEKNYFQPIVIQDQCVIRAPFHQAFPEIKFEIIIEPKMAFGTGHHETTSMMLEHILEAEIAGKTVLDMGCGTGVLAILSALRKASEITAIDFDEWSYESTLENSGKNNVPQIVALHGDATVIPNTTYDIILANINLNVLIADMGAYRKVCKPGTLLYLSGFYETDIAQLMETCTKFGFQLQQQKVKNKWASLKLIAI